MVMHTLIREIISNWYFFIASWLVLTAVVWLIFVKWRQVDKIIWKKVDLFWFPLTTISVFIIIDENRAMFLGQEAEMASFRAKREAEDIKYKLNVEWICRAAIRSDMSPDDFEIQEAVRTFACSWVRSTMTNISPELDSLK